jgi:8-oxo-dGTP pyrophosphatase MutT (NUDIX family)
VSLAAFAALGRALSARPPGAAAPFAPEEIDPAHLPPGGFVRAAVLVPLHEKDGEPHVLLTRRPPHLRHNPGQFAFPGGKLEPDEGDLAAALREAREEVALDPARAEVLGRLTDTLVLRSAFRLTPWVAAVPYPYPYAPAAGEVEAILHLPLAALAREGVHRIERGTAYGKTVDVHFYDVGAGEVWGATARILHELLAVWRDL